MQNKAVIIFMWLTVITSLEGINILPGVYVLQLLCENLGLENKSSSI